MLGVRILKKETIDSMFVDQTASLGVSPENGISGPDPIVCIIHIFPVYKSPKKD